MSHFASRTTVLRRFAAACALAFAAAGASAQSIARGPNPNEPAPEEILRAHGVDPDAEVSVTRFLSDGIPASRRASGLPPAPRRKLELLPAVMEIAARRGYQSARAPLMRLLQGDYSPGLLRMVNDDAAKIGRAGRGIFLRQVDQALQFGAANALSVLDERASLPWIYRRWEQETAVLGKINYALAGATMGDERYLEFFAEEAANPEPAISFAAFQALEDISGLSFDIHPYTPAAVRRDTAERARRWAENASAGSLPSQKEIVERRLQPYQPPDRLPEKAATVRHHLLFSEIVFASGDVARQARESRVFLQELGETPERARELLEPIALRADEDVDVRVQAILWLGRALGKKEAEPLLRKLALDENRPVREQAEAFLKQTSP